MEDELGFDFESPATSARTSCHNFTPTTLTGFAINCRGDTPPLGDDARSTRASAGDAANTSAGGSADDKATRETPSQEDIGAERAASSVTSAGPQSFAWNTAGAQRLSMRAAGLHRAARFVGGGCGVVWGGAQESPDLAGNWQDSGGLLGATAAADVAAAAMGQQWWFSSGPRQQQG